MGKCCMKVWNHMQYLKLGMGLRNNSSISWFETKTRQKKYNEKHSWSMKETVLRKKNCIKTTCNRQNLRSWKKVQDAVKYHTCSLQIISRNAGGTQIMVFQTRNNQCAFLNECTHFESFCYMLDKNQEVNTMAASKALLCDL